MFFLTTKKRSKKPIYQNPMFWPSIFWSPNLFCFSFSVRFLSGLHPLEWHPRGQPDVVLAPWIHHFCFFGLKKWFQKCASHPKKKTMAQSGSMRFHFLTLFCVCFVVLNLWKMDTKIPQQVDHSSSHWHQEQCRELCGLFFAGFLAARQDMLFKSWWWITSFVDKWQFSSLGPPPQVAGAHLSDHVDLHGDLTLWHGGVDSVDQRSVPFWDVLVANWFHRWPFEISSAEARCFIETESIHKKVAGHVKWFLFLYFLSVLKCAKNWPLDQFLEIDAATNLNYHKFWPFWLIAVMSTYETMKPWRVETVARQASAQFHPEKLDLISSWAFFFFFWWVNEFWKPTISPVSTWELFGCFCWWCVFWLLRFQFRLDT